MGADSRTVPQSDNRVYTTSDLMKLAPTPLQDKMKSLVTSKMAAEDAETKQETQLETTVQNAAVGGAETTTDRDGQTPTKPQTVRIQALEEALGEEVTEKTGPTANNESTVESKPADKPAAVARASPPGEKEKQKKKKARKPKKTLPDGTPKPPKIKATGFEEFYAEGPIHPDVYAEEINTIYHPSRDFAERMESCLYRYKEKRKLNSVRNDILHKYLSLGGIDTTIASFQGGKDKDNDDYDSDEDDEFGSDYDGPTVKNITTPLKPVASIFDTSQRGITKFYNPFAPQNWRIDWVGVASAFLSDRACYLFGLNDEAIDEFTGVVVNFLNYVLMHSAAPEYTNDILKTQKIARQAKTELKKVRILSNIFPGSFHRALSILTGGRDKLVYLRDEAETEAERKEAEEEETEFDEDKHFTIPKCKLTIQAAIQILGTPEQIKLLAELKEGDSIKVVKEETLGFEIVGVTYPTAEQVKEFEAMTFETGLVKPMGFVHVKPWINDKMKIHYDMTPSEARAAAREERRLEKEKAVRLARGEPDGDPTQSFIVSSHVLEHVIIGMKFQAKVREIVGGVRFVDVLEKVFPSYYEVIENERMMDWREPKKTDRKPPTCEDKEFGGEPEGGGQEEGGEGRENAIED